MRSINYHWVVPEFKENAKISFLAAQSSYRSLVVSPSVGQSVMVVKKWPLEYQMVIITYLPSNLCDSSESDISDSSDSCDSSDSGDSSGSNDSSDRSDRKNNFIYFFCWAFFEGRKKSQKK